MPFTWARVIPEGWSQHHAPIAAGGMNATIRITDPDRTSPGRWDEGTEQQVPGETYVAYDGPARIQAVDTATDSEQATQDITQRRYLVQMLFDAPRIEQGWPVVVTECRNDADLVAWTTERPMVVADVQHGSERFTRDLICTLNQD